MTTDVRPTSNAAHTGSDDTPIVQHPYIPLTGDDRDAMLAAVGVSSTAELFADIPAEHFRPALAIPDALSEVELLDHTRTLAARNHTAADHACFLGAGAYRHFRPSLIDPIVMRGEFLTSYTPYQPEVAQGTLQTIFEFQSLVCELTGMDVANAGMYDGASALAEACLMACAVTNRRRIAISDRVHPNWIATVRSYAHGRDIAVDVQPHGAFSVTDEHACLAVQQPDFLGRIAVAASAWGDAAHEAGALYVVAADPVSLGVLRPPAQYGADIVVGEGQSLGVPLSFGGPFVGLFACREKYIRQLPGRIVGETTDSDDKRGYVLTLQTREQHIRRERATSNICTSQQLIALSTAMYLAVLGPQGLRRVGELCFEKAHDLAARIGRIPGYAVEDDEPWLHEFVIRTPKPPAAINAALLERGIIGGFDLGDGRMLLCATELNTAEELDRMVAALAEVSR
jgi:glycine dehydrogenase subunit 1